MNSGIQFQFKIPESSHGFLIYKLYAKWESGIKSLLKDLNLTHPQFVILTTSAWFVTFENAPTQKELSDKTGIDVMTTSVVIRGLLKKGYIERILNSEDTRSYNISLTEDGRRLVQQAMQAVDSYDGRFFSVLGDREREILRTLICQLVYE